MEKILTVSIAAYNVEKYIRKTLDSLLVDNIDDLEILVEDDGGTDSTADIVNEYEKKYPGIVKLVHKKNGGYGSTINKSIDLAKGKYFKQLDGDDWYDSDNFAKFLDILRTVDTDVVYTPYKEFREVSGEYRFKDFFDGELNKKYKIKDVILEANHYLNMYTLCYKTQMLKSNNIQLLENCFYTDTLYAMYPVAIAEDIFITHNPIYIYRLEREGQSVSLEGHIKHYKDHVRVCNNIIDFYNEKKKYIDSNKNTYFLDYTMKHTARTITEFYMVLDTNKENLKSIKDFDKLVLEKNKIIHDKIGNQSKIIRLLRMANYNYYIYKLCHIMKMAKLKR